MSRILTWNIIFRVLQLMFYFVLHEILYPTYKIPVNWISMYKKIHQSYLHKILFHVFFPNFLLFKLLYSTFCTWL